jgi:hypothetical protein
LTGAGIDVSTVNTRMADSINEFLNQAILVGGEVPRAMQPILEGLAQQGLLTDAAGEKITDIGQLNLKWSESMTQGFDRVVMKLQELINGLGLASNAINAIPTDLSVRVRYETDYSGGGPETVEPVAFAKGGIVTSPTYGVFGEAGPEAIIPLSKLGDMTGGSEIGELKAEITELRRVIQDQSADTMRQFTVALKNAQVFARA